MRTELTTIQRRVGITTVFVTHDQEEAMSIADRIAVMNAGVLEQMDAPEEIYARPATLFVASFIGTMNRLDASVDSAGWLTAGPFACPTARRRRASRQAEPLVAGDSARKTWCSRSAATACPPASTAPSTSATTAASA